jgi:hypothetical protein
MQWLSRSSASTQTSRARYQEGLYLAMRSVGILLSLISKMIKDASFDGPAHALTVTDLILSNFLQIEAFEYRDYVLGRIAALEIVHIIFEF